MCKKKIERCCLKCSYSLDHLKGAVCPGCGQGYVLDDPETWKDYKQSGVLGWLIGQQKGRKSLRLLLCFLPIFVWLSALFGLFCYLYPVGLLGDFFASYYQMDCLMAAFSISVIAFPFGLVLFILDKHCPELRMIWHVFLFCVYCLVSFMAFVCIPMTMV